ncbi:hypothetical protein COV20_00700 [Candidatus Woesearchaeota archaeon CG10_big_fil_rev_8_21_14_0_10_45_16]|nr:MAG: hypothetical protein COV20_00700 [Candidatus Woesearchaeota archaeon CG10_big_fil_rev_8_21_14_0_10_45_16]
MIRKITTADNTETFLNETVGESYHSQTGAVEEALKKYAIPCKIAEKAKSGKIRILDAFFGIGYNSAMAIDIALKENPDCEIEVIGLENDPEIIQKMQEIDPPIAFFTHYKKLTKDNLKFKEGKVSVKILLGDARETVKQLSENHFDAVFFDPFSPKTMPEMWDTSLFEQMYRVMSDSAILATYSCARLGRENMSKAGLFYNDGPTVGRRGPGTVATKWL